MIDCSNWKEKKKDFEKDEWKKKKEKEERSSSHLNIGPWHGRITDRKRRCKTALLERKPTGISACVIRCNRYIPSSVQVSWRRWDNSHPENFRFPANPRRSRVWCLRRTRKDHPLGDLVAPGRKILPVPGAYRSKRFFLPPPGSATNPGRIGSNGWFVSCIYWLMGTHSPGPSLSLSLSLFFLSFRFCFRSRFVTILFLFLSKL